jgi:hypothetical protein
MLLCVSSPPSSCLILLLTVMQCMTSYIAHFKTGSLGLQDSVISAAVGAAEEAGGGGGGSGAAAV